MCEVSLQKRFVRLPLSQAGGRCRSNRRGKNRGGGRSRRTGKGSADFLITFWNVRTEHTGLSDATQLAGDKVQTQAEIEAENHRLYE